MYNVSINHPTYNLDLSYADKELNSMINAHKKNNKSRIHPEIKFNLKIKMIILISLLIIGIFVIFGLFLRSFISSTIEDQIGKRALSVAQSVANMPEIKAAFQLEDSTSVIQPIVTHLQKDTEAEFIVVGSR